LYPQEDQVDVRIGVTQTPKELVIEVADDTDRDALQKLVTATIAGAESTLWLTDSKGKRVGVVASKISYVEIGNAENERRIGFGA
jgi:hypothetical protein